MKWIIWIFILFPFCSIFAQPDSSSTWDQSRSQEYTKLSGPRLGITLVTAESADKLKDELDAGPFVTQFGWQWETRFFTVEGGMTGVTEFVLLVGGMEQGVVLPSLSVLVGFRSPRGAEFGVGPNVSLAGAGYVIAFGVTTKHGKLNIPMNFSIAMTQKSPRFSLLFGFNAAKF
jgi:hypothetical protein